MTENQENAIELISIYCRLDRAGLRRWLINNAVDPITLWGRLNTRFFETFNELTEAILNDEPLPITENKG